MVIDNLLKFRTHDFGILCFGGVTNVNLVYAGSGHKLCVRRVAPEKMPADAEKYLVFYLVLTMPSLGR